MIFVDVFLVVLASAFLLWAINYSILAQTIDDRREAIGNFIISFTLLFLAVVSIVFVAGYDGGF